ncbi:MAG: ferredoxin [Deltaproteobacteria bacterium]|nr:ferredoxin [Deltaproteobacteria bacterium]
MKITIDRTKCEGYAKCLQASPKVFKLDAKMIAEVIDAKGDSDEKILLAAKICPTKAITLEQEGTGKKLFPVD